MPGCEGCDFEHAPEVCHAQAIGWKRGCELRRMGRKDYADLIRRLTLGIGPEPVVVVAQERPPHPSGKPRVSLGVDQKAIRRR